MTRDDAYRAGAAQRDDARGRRGARSATCSRDDPEVAGALGDERARRVLRPRAPRSPTSAAPFDALDDCRRSPDEPARAARTTTPGKVRELYEVDHDRMLVVASDRISVFDVVLPDLIPDKGRVLTALSTFWFEQTARPRAQPPRVVRPHRLPRDRGPRRRGPGDARAGRRAGAARVRRPRLPVRLGVDRLRGDRARCMGRALPAGPARRPSGCPSRSSRPPPRPRRATTCPLTDAEAAALVGRRALRAAPRPHAARSTRSAPRSRPSAG